MKTDPIKVKIKTSGLENELQKKEKKIMLRISFTHDNPYLLATDNIPNYADWLEEKCIELQDIIYRNNKQILELIKSKE